MAVTPAPVSANQTNYLNGLVKAGGGNAEWAKAQLGSVPQPSATSTPRPLALNNNDGRGGLTQSQLDAMQKGLIGLGTNFGTGASQTPAPQSNSLTPNAAPLSATPPVGGVPKPDYAGIAASRIAAQRAALAGSVAAYDASRKSAFDYMTKNTQDQRTLDDAMFQENNNPFGGKYAYDKTNILRNNNIQDTQNQTNYQNDISASDAKLAAFDAGSAGQQQDIMDQLQQRDFTNNISQAGVTGQYMNPQTGQTQQTQSAQGQAFNQSLDTAKYGLDVQKQHIDLANKLSELFGVQVNPTSDPMQAYAQVAGLSTTAAQKIAQDAKQSTFDNAVKLALANNTITQTQATILNQARQADISQQNANNGTLNANTSAANSEWAQNPNNPDNLYKQSEIAKNNAPKPKTADSYKTDPNFSADVAHMKSNPADASKLDSNAQQFIDAYGYDGYVALRKAAGLE